ncbi:MAG: efflux RND transporter periplasmic adaptor subunit [Firmicutes bacterium]|nr:efflux RND transporter periplasmic adaptor subunit [Bacillota bacterium]
MKLLHKWPVVILLILCVALQGCFFFPKEETIKSLPSPGRATEASYEMKTVQRGDISKVVVVNVQYLPVANENLSVADTRLPFTEVLCGLGDQVEPGDLIARQDCTALEKELDSLLTEQEHAQMEKAALEEMRDLKASQQAELWAAASYNDRQNMQTEDEVYASYTTQIRRVEDQLTILEIRIAECKDQIAGRELRASIKGTVTYFMSLDEKGYLTVSNASTVAVVSDIFNSYFRAETEYYSTFKTGEIYSITIKSTDYELEAVDTDAIGGDKKPAGSEKQYVYFRLVTPDISMESGTRGVIRLTTDSREDVLYVASNAVHEQSDGRHIVYCFDENQILYIREITVGLNTGSFIEIIDGLEEGDQVAVES